MCHRKQDILSLSCWAPPGQKSGLPTVRSSSSGVIPKPDLVHMGSLPSIPTRSDPPAQRRCKRAEVKQKILWNCVEKHLQVLILDLAWPGIHRSSGSSFQCGSLALATTPYTLCWRFSKNRMENQFSKSKFSKSKFPKSKFS